MTDVKLLQEMDLIEPALPALLDPAKSSLLSWIKLLLICKKKYDNENSLLGNKRHLHSVISLFENVVLLSSPTSMLQSSINNVGKKMIPPNGTPMAPILDKMCFI